jgi:uncharacterized protein (DUF1697 family)
MGRTTSRTKTAVPGLTRVGRPGRRPESEPFLVVLRAVNVGGHGAVRTSELPARFPDWSVTNIGAAGTFVVAGARSPQEVRTRFVDAIGFPTDVIVREAKEFRRLWTGRPSSWSAGDAAERRFVTFLRAAPTRAVPLPHSVPSADAWEVRLDALVGNDVLSSHLPRGDRRAFYANEVVERAYGIPGTTRGWETLERVAARLPAP